MNLGHELSQGQNRQTRIIISEFQGYSTGPGWSVRQAIRAPRYFRAWESLRSIIQVDGILAPVVDKSTRVRKREKRERRKVEREIEERNQRKKLKRKMMKERLGSSEVMLGNVTGGRRWWTAGSGGRLMRNPKKRHEKQGNQSLFFDFDYWPPIGGHGFARG